MKQRSNPAFRPLSRCVPALASIKGVNQALLLAGFTHSIPVSHLTVIPRRISHVEVVTPVVVVQESIQCNRLVRVFCLIDMAAEASMVQAATIPLPDKPLLPLTIPKDRELECAPCTFVSFSMPVTTDKEPGSIIPVVTPW
jgi:hypothetical protein